jgi:serine/threonine protein kinase
VKNPSTLLTFRNEILPSSAQLLEADDPVTIGGLRLTGRLRSSGTGIVYLACDGTAGLVAVKTARTESDEKVRDRLRTEAACSQRLPSFCTARLVHDGTDHTPPYLVSDHVAGPSLEQVVDANGPLAPGLVGELAAELARALAAIHEAGVIHGNLTPANVLITKQGLRVIDFGVAQEISASGEPAEIGAVADNPGWLAPELLTGGPPGPACDVYGWGCLVGYAATGHSPHEETGPTHLDEDVLHLVEAALGETPADRPSAAELLARLDADADAGTGPRPADDPDPPPAAEAASHTTSHTPKHRMPTRRSRTIATVAVLVAVAAALLIVIPLRSGGSQPNALAPAQPIQSPPEPSPSPRVRAQPPAGAHPHRGPKASNTSAIAVVNQPSRATRKVRSMRKLRRSIQMSCSSMPSPWCSRSAADVVDAWERAFTRHPDHDQDR